MRTRLLGESGLEVSAIGLGAMPLSASGRPERNGAHQVIRAALDAGVSLIDTADAYGKDELEVGHNERLLGEALRNLGRLSGEDRVLVATKGGCTRYGGGWQTNGRPDHLTEACNRSLVALGVETIELYQLHAPDDDVPFAESVGALRDLKQSGKIQHVGISNVTVEEIIEARSIVPIVSVQNRCNILDTTHFANGVAGYCHSEGIALLAHSPMGGHTRHLRSREHERLSELSKRTGASNYELMLAWLLHWSPAIVPIPGASRPASITSSAGAVDLVLDDETRAALDELAGVAPAPE